MNRIHLTHDSTVKAIILTCLFLLSLAQHIHADTVKEDKARVAAQNWYRHYAPENKKSALVSRFSEYKHNERTAFYIYNFDQGGFVLVSANDAVMPVLGYGFDHSAPDEITNEAVKGWFDNYARQIDTAFVLNLKSNELEAKWQEVLENRIPLMNGNSVGPLLTTTWDQGWPYNAMCPEDPNGPGGHTWAGCVAVALAQILNFHEWPLKGAGSISYESKCFTWSPPDSITVNFSDQEYFWESMEDSIILENDSLAKLIFNTGASTGSQYGAQSTSVRSFYIQNNDGTLERKTAIEILLSSFFRYNYDSITASIKGFDNDWILLLKNEINNNRPIYYEGGDWGELGHAWVCDGYDNEHFFHFNFGWSGLYNGYYTVNNITPGLYSFNDFQLAVTGIIPDTSSAFIDNDTLWSGLINQSTNVIIPRGHTLSLAPGTHLSMGSGTRILSLGYIKSLGLVNDEVILTSIDTNLRWNGITINDDYLWGYNIYQNNDSSIFRNTEISYSEDYGISIVGLSEKGTSVIIDSCILKYNFGGDLYSFSNYLYLTNSVFLNRGLLNWDDVNIHYPFARIENNIFNKTLIEIAMSGEIDFSSNVVLNNSRLHISVWEDGTYNFKSNLFHGNQDAITCNSSEVNLINNLFTNNTNAIKIYPSNGNRLINNTFSNNTNGIVFDSYFGSVLDDTLINNIIYNNTNNIVLIGDATPYMRHCLIQNGLNGIVNETSYNLNQMNIDSIYDGYPDFVNPSPVIGLVTSSISNYSWNLGAKSAAIDLAGIDTSLLLLPITDIVGNPRFTRTLDIGAYESLLTPSLSPLVLKNPLSQTKCVGSNVIFSTFIRGDSLEFEWFFNSTSIPFSNNDSLLINNLILSDTGNYFCVARNSHGCDTTKMAFLKLIHLPPLVLGEIQGPDTITWWQNSNFCVDEQSNTIYDWSVLNCQTTFTSNCIEFMPLDTNSSCLIKVVATDLCGNIDSVQKNIVVLPFSPPEPYGIITGPSVVYFGQQVNYEMNFGNFDIEIIKELPYGFMNIAENRYWIVCEVSNYALTQSLFKVRWAKASPVTNEIYYGQYINLPITVVDSLHHLPKIVGPDSITTFEDAITYSIDSLIPASSYEWIYPEGFIPIGETNKRTITFLANTSSCNLMLKVRGVNLNWRGPYYEKSIINLPAMDAGFITGESINCQGQTGITYSIIPIQNATSYIWTLPPGATGTSTTNSITVNFGLEAISGEISVKGVNDCGEGEAASLFIEVNPLPAATSSIMGNSSICAGSTNIVYSIEPVQNATSYQWNLPPGATGSSTTNSITVNFGAQSVSGEITVKGINDCGEGEAAGLFIEVNPLPSEAGVISGGSIVCQGNNSVAYTVPVIGNATSYLWTLPNGASGTSTTNSISVDYSSSAISGSISVKGLNSCGEGIVSTLAVTVNPLPLAAGEISGSSIVCQGNNSVAYTVPVIGNATSYLWTLPNGAFGTSTSNSIAVDYGNTATSGNITVKGINSCGEGTLSTLAVTVNPLPLAAGEISGSSIVCQGNNSVAYTVPAIANATTYVWTLPIGASGTSTTNSISVNYGSSATSGNITVKGINSCGEGAGSTLPITVNPLPMAAGVISGSTIVCQGQNAVAYTVPAIANATSYVWTLPNGANGTSVSNSISVDYSSSAISGNITVRGINTCGEGTGSALPITVNFIPMAAGAISGSSIVCQGQNAVVYTVPAITNATSYVWTLPNEASGTSITNSISVDYSASANSGNITVKGINSCGEGAGSTLPITVNPVPMAAGVISGSSIVCQGQDAVAYTVPVISNATSYVWVLPNGASGTSTTNSISVDYGSSATSGNITVKGINSCGEGAGSTLAITVNPLPASAGVITGSTTVCQASTQSYSVTNVTGMSYSWTAPIGWTINSGQGTNSIFVTVGSSPGNITVTPSNSCGSGNSSTLAVTVNTVPNQPSEIIGNVNPCEGYTGIYSVTNVVGVSYNWTIPTGAVFIDGQGTNSVVVSMGTTGGNVIVTPSNTCGNGLARSLAVVVNNPPSETPSQAFGPETVNTYTTISSLYTTNAVADANYYLWDLFPTDAGVLSTGNDTSVTITWNTSFIGNCALMVKAVNNCGESQYSIPKIIYVDYITSLGEVKNTAISIFPNPSDGTFRVISEVPLEWLSLKDMTGKSVYQIAVDGLKTVDMKASDAAKGMYLLEVQHAKGVERIKVVIR